MKIRDLRGAASAIAVAGLTIGQACDAEKQPTDNTGQTSLMALAAATGQALAA